MRISEELEKAGFFWLPGKPGIKVPGTIFIRDGGHIELEILGSFSEKRISLGDEEDLSRIVGTVELFGYVTLEDCFYTSRKLTFGAWEGRSKICVNRLLTNVAYDEGENVTLNSITFSVEGIDDWINLDGTTVSYAQDYKSVEIKSSPLPKIDFSIDEDVTISIEFTYKYPGSPISDAVCVSQKTFFTIRSERGLELQDLSSYAHKITELLSFAIDKPVSIRNVNATADDIKNEDTDRSIPIGLYYASFMHVDDIPDIKWHEMLFRFTDVQDEFGGMLIKWLQMYDAVGPSLGLFFSTRVNAQRYIDGKFLAIIQALETYSRRTSTEQQMDESDFSEILKKLESACPDEKKEWLLQRLTYANELSLSQRLKKLISPIKSYLGNSKQRNSFIQKVVNTRNYFTHYDKSLEGVAAKGRDLWLAYIKLEAIYQMILLLDLGFDTERLKNVIERNNSIKQKLNET